MTRWIAIAAVVAAATAGVARADVFQVVPDQAPVTAPALSVPVGLASAEVPNPAGTVTAVPYSGVTQQLEYPQLVGIWQRAGATYGIPWQVLGAINKIESNFGRNMGPSSAGAVGWMQFMPSTWERWGVDADGDGVADPWDPDDAIFAAARYLAASGGRTDISRAVFSYNHAQWYVDEVLGMARLMGDMGVDATFTLDKLALRVGAARKKVVAANRELLAAQEADDALAATESRLEQRSEAAALLSDRLSFDRLAAAAEFQHDQSSAHVSELEDSLDAARNALDKARSSATIASFAPGAAQLTGGPIVQGRYVFPVGGGPAQVSVGHTHHDYPAADIAAPEGAPEYALTNMTVLRAWHIPNGKCGIGFTAQAWDGREWTYCHMSYMEPSVIEGAPLTSGQPVGLVGHTGHATGPHLHLQLHPASTYPQDLAWFASFAGTAFRWQDAATPSAGPLFTVVSTDESTDGVITFTTGS